MTKESGEMSPTVEETKLSPTDQDTVTPPTESETTQPKEIPVLDKEKEKQPSEEEDEEEKPAESWPIIEEAAPDASFEAGSGGETHEFGEEEDEDDD